MITFGLSRSSLGFSRSVSLAGSDDEGGVIPLDLNWVDDSDNQLIDDQNNELYVLAPEAHDWTTSGGDTLIDQLSQTLIFVEN